MATYTFDGEKYKLASTHQKEWGSRMIAELTLRGDEWILDLGCGDGVLTQQLAQRVPRGRVMGIDSSESMIGTAARLARINLGFRRVNIDAMVFDGSFDLVFSNATLQWIKDHEAMLLRVKRALKPGGRVRFNFAADGNCGSFIAVVREVMRQDTFHRYFAGFEWPWVMPKPEDYGHLVREAGFRQVRAWGENADRYFADAEEMIRWVDQPSLVPFLPRLPDAHRLAFRDAVISAMLARCEQPDGTCFETFRRVNVAAVKPQLAIDSVPWFVLK